METKPFILAIEDDEFYIKELHMELDGRADFKSFTSPSNFELQVTPEDIDKANLILVDYDYKTGTAVKSKLAEYIRQELDYKGKLVLCSLLSNFKQDNRKIRKDYDVVIHKKELSWEKLDQILNQ